MSTPIYNEAETGTTNKGKTPSSSAVLSRASVYAPLKSYDFSADSEQSSSIPKNLQDASLLQFYGKVSEDFHRTAPRLDCKNTAGRPLSVSDITGRIQQRALTLVGGGGYTISAAAKKGQPPLSSNPSTIAPSKSQKKRKREHLLQRIRGSRQSTDQLQLNDDANFLQQLNAEWNVYASGILQLSTVEPETTMALVSRRAKQLALGAIEWVGARVRVDQCPSSKGREGLSGILVAQTTNTWRIVPVIPSNQAGASISSADDTDATTKNASSCPWNLKKIVIVPKVGSSLAVLISLAKGSNVKVESNEPRYLSIVLQASKPKSK